MRSRLIVQGRDDSSTSELLKRRHVQVVSWQDWLRINAEEEKQGAAVSKPREKITSIPAMLRVMA